MRTWRGLGMILNAECPHRSMFEAFDRVVVQIDVRDVYIIQIQTIRIDCKTVILRRDFNLLSFEVVNRVISAVMPELQLIGLSAERQPHDLMAKTDPENRLLTHKVTDILN